MWVFEKYAKEVVDDNGIRFPLVENNNGNNDHRDEEDEQNEIDNKACSPTESSTTRLFLLLMLCLQFFILFS